MDTLRFHSTQRYVSQVPLRRLLFCVRVWRSPLVEEHLEELLCNVTVPWDGKVFSPAEKLEKIRAFASMETRHGERSMREDVHVGDSGDMEMCALQAVLEGRQDVMLSAAAAAVGGLQKHLEATDSAFFTHPSGEDYINEGEEDCPVDPSQFSSSLAAIVLRQHRAQHQQSNKMFFMWAVGSVIAPNGDSTAGMRWEGKERVICTITAEQSDMYFRAKPSINETHTLFVDSLHVYLFRITVSTTEEVISVQSGPTDLIQQISTMALQVNNRLSEPNYARRDGLQRILLQQVTAAEGEEPLIDVPMAAAVATAAAKTPFARSPSMCRVRYHIFGTVERCIGVPEDALCLRCQWQHGVPKYEEQEEDEGDDVDWAKGKMVSFTTQLAFASCMVLEDFLVLPVHTFNIAFEHHFDEVGTTPLWLIVTVYSGTGSGQQAPVGYTAIPVPHTHPGRHSLRALLWRPQQTGREFLRSALVGGAPALVDARDAAMRVGGGGGGGGMSVRHGLLTESSGELEVSVMVMQQHGTVG